MQLLVKHIRQLVTVAAHGKRMKAGREMRELGIVENGSVLVQDGVIAWVGRTDQLGVAIEEDATVIDGDGCIMLPGFIDAHTHLLFAGSRADEFAVRASGKSYQEIAGAGGGILSTVHATRSATKKDLKKVASQRLDAMLQHGTTTAEVKSGYCLTEEGELKLLEAMKELMDEHYATIIPTFLGAHAVPPEYAGRSDDYVELLTGHLLPLVAQRGLARYCDVFCENGYFTVDQSRRLLTKARELGLGVKIHADQLNQIGASRLGSELRATSVDHLERIDSEGIDALKESGSVAVALPGVSFFMNERYAPARRLIDAGIPVAVASDFNPGTCMAFSIPLMMTIACTQMGLTPEEAITASTLNGAAAVGYSQFVGSVEVGKNADLVLYDVPDYRHLAYYFGLNHVAKVIKKGTILEF